MTMEFTAENFEAQVLNNTKPVIVDFWAAWCGPCKMMGPVVDTLASELADTVCVGKVNIDEQESIAVKYGIMTIPTIALFREGKVVATSVGFVPKAKLLHALGL